MVIIKSNQN